jgi:hypothetical protein
MLLPTFILTSLGYVVFAGIAIFRELRDRESQSDNALHPCAKFVFSGGVPVVVAATMAYLFLIVGGATTVQYNVGSPSRMDVWSTWVGLWPLFLLLTATSGLGSLIWIIVCVVKERPLTHILAATASLCLSVLAFFTVGAYFPSA